MDDYRRMQSKLKNNLRMASTFSKELLHYKFIKTLPSTDPKLVELTEKMTLAGAQAEAVKATMADVIRLSKEAGGSSNAQTTTAATGEPPGSSKDDTIILDNDVDDSTIPGVPSLQIELEEIRKRNREKWMKMKSTEQPPLIPTNQNPKYVDQFMGRMFYGMQNNGPNIRKPITPQPNTRTMFSSVSKRAKWSKNTNTTRGVEADNSYEEKFRKDIVPPNEIDVSFDDIGSLEETKKLIHELVILPTIRPELFQGGLLRPCKGILLFGPPGTGKTMLAKAIAKECESNFISVSSSSIFNKWLGESEQNAKALFSLAAKVAPTVIFVDEIDSFLGRRGSDDHDHGTSRKVKNEFMSLWDGLRTKAGNQILVLGATNRPFDLDDAIIRRFERRILVDLPCENSRESILKRILLKENVKDMDFKELAVITEGYTGSDLKNLCITAAYLPLRELLEKERLASMNRNTGKKFPLRALNMDDMKKAKKQVGASFSADGAEMLKMKKWNDLYGEGGCRIK